VDHITLGTALTVMTAQPVPAQRVPPVVDDNLLPDMGRMTQEWQPAEAGVSCQFLFRLGTRI